MKTFVFFASVFAGLLSPAYGQLYLIQGSATPKTAGGYSMSLLQVDADGSVRTISQVLPGGRTGGAEWIGVSSDHRKAVLLPKMPSHTITVVDFDTAAVTKICEAPAAPAGMGAFPFEEWLADIPAKGLVYVEVYGTADTRRLERGISLPGDDVARGMLVDASVPCDRSFVPVTHSDIKSLVFDGVAHLGFSGSQPITIGKDGAPVVGWLGREQTYWDYRVPDSVMRKVAQPNASVLVNNGQVFVAFVSDDATKLWDLAVLRKKDNTWHAVGGQGASGPFVRSFGSFVALTETLPKTAQNHESAGQGEWRKTETPTGGSLEARIGFLPYVLPGRLDLYDANTEKMYNIVTNQGDSEILLVEDNTVYYRVSDRLYSAAIGKEGLEPAKLLATSESIRDVHWAFVKH